MNTLNDSPSDLVIEDVVNLWTLPSDLVIEDVVNLWTLTNSEHAHVLKHL